MKQNDKDTGGVVAEKNILVVDDEEPIRILLEKALKKHGYVVHTASTGEDALECLKQNNILVVFLDLSLPTMDGVELCREIRKKIPDAIVHAITGYASDYELDEHKDVGFEMCFTKPFELKSIIEAAKDAFNKLK